jgi:hypothetical protein
MYGVNGFGCPETSTDWNLAAVEAAERLASHRRTTNQGAVPWWRAGVFVVFGNRGYSESDEGPAMVTLFRQKLDDMELTELGFGLDSTGYTWAMLVGPGEILESSPENNPQASVTIEDLAVVLQLAYFVTEAVRIAKGIGFDTTDPSWEAYKKLQGLAEMQEISPDDPDDYDEPGDYNDYNDNFYDDEGD